MFQIKAQIEQKMVISREMKNLMLECQSIWRVLREIKTPSMHTFDDPVDQMMFDFKDSHDIEVPILKMGPATYRFG